MSGPWWTPEAGSRVASALRAQAGAAQPLVFPGDVELTVAALLARADGFTPDWSYRPDDDPGVVLGRLFAEQLELVRERMLRVPEKLLVELLRSAGIEQAPPTPAALLLEFAASRAARAPVSVPAAFRVGATAADGSRELVVFETERELHVTDGSVIEVHGGRESLRDASEQNLAGDASFAAFGADARAGAALWLGLSGATAPAPRLSLGIALADRGEAPPPARASAGVSPRVAPSAVLRWEAIDGGAVVPLQVLLDETGGLRRSGVVELVAPPSWRPSRPALLGAGEPRRFLRLRIASGEYEQPPLLRFVRAHVARAIAARTVRGEQVARADALDPRRYKLRHAPVIENSLVLSVHDGREARRYREVASLVDQAADAEVYTLDRATGEITFGDGVHGARVPEGFRNVLAEAYRVGGGPAGAVGAGEAKRLLASAPFLSSAINPLPASGGMPIEPREDTLLRGPEVLRARGRAVAARDYELLALRAQGAEVARVYAAATYDAELLAGGMPGVVTLFVVPPDRGDGTPPVPDEPTLRAVARHVSERLAPAGVEIVAAAPRYQRVRVDTQAVVEPTADASAVMAALAARIDAYLHPIRGGQGGRGWTPGAPIRHPALLRELLAVDGVRALRSLTLYLDGVRSPGCGDHPLAELALPWPEGHRIRASAEAVR